MKLGKVAVGMGLGLMMTLGAWGQGAPPAQAAPPANPPQAQQQNPPPASPQNPPAADQQNPPPAGINPTQQANPAPAVAAGDNGTPPLFGGNWEVFAGASMLFPKATSANDETLGFNNVVGETGGIRYHIDGWNAIDIRYAYAQWTQVYGAVFTSISNSNQFTMDYALTLPTDGPIRPYVMGGGGIIRFNPTPASIAVQPGENGQNKAALVYGGGLDFRLPHNFSLRVEYSGVFFRVPDFTLLAIGKWDHSAEPTLLLVYHF